MITNWTKPFAKAESVGLCAIKSGDLNALFLKMRCLVLRCDVNVQCVKNMFPHLEELEIYAYRTPKEYVEAILRMNPHLQVLRLYGGSFDAKFMESINEYIQALRILDIRCGKGFFAPKNCSVHLKNVTEFYIIFDGNALVPEIPFLFNNLKKLQLTVDNFELTNDVKQFIKQNPSLINIKIYLRKQIFNMVAEEIKKKFAIKFQKLRV